MKYFLFYKKSWKNLEKKKAPRISLVWWGNSSLFFFDNLIIFSSSLFSIYAWLDFSLVCFSLWDFPKNVILFLNKTSASFFTCAGCNHSRGHTLRRPAVRLPAPLSRPPVSKRQRTVMELHVESRLLRIPVHLLNSFRTKTLFPDCATSF